MHIFVDQNHCPLNSVIHFPRNTKIMPSAVKNAVFCGMNPPVRFRAPLDLQ